MTEFDVTILFRTILEKASQDSDIWYDFLTFDDQNNRPRTSQEIDECLKLINKQFIKIFGVPLYILDE